MHLLYSAAGGEGRGWAPTTPCPAANRMGGDQLGQVNKRAQALSTSDGCMGEVMAGRYWVKEEKGGSGLMRAHKWPAVPRGASHLEDIQEEEGAVQQGERVRGTTAGSKGAGQWEGGVSTVTIEPAG